MAQRYHVTLEDDLDGTKAEETIRFALDGTEYEIDLSKKNAKALREALSGYIEAGRRVKAASAGRRRSAARGGRDEARNIREWAAENGYEVSARGRVPSQVREAYDAAH